MTFEEFVFAMYMVGYGYMGIILAFDIFERWGERKVMSKETCLTKLKAAWQKYNLKIHGYEYTLHESFCYREELQKAIDEFAKEMGWDTK